MAIVNLNVLVKTACLILTVKASDVDNSSDSSFGWFSSGLLSLLPRLEVNEVTEHFETEYDFIVVGSGSAGAVIANRLSEIPKWKILLLEVGDLANILTDEPGIAAIFQFSNYNWGYLMEKEDNVCLGMKQQRCAWPRGKALGGSSIINYMIHVRGNRYDYDRWAGLGNPGWSYRDVLPYFLKSEDSHLAVQDEGYHAKGGYLTISDVPTRSKSVRAFLEAARQAGHEILDYNGKNQLGFSYVHSTTRDGRRCSVEKAFLRPIAGRKNLKISTRSRVTRVIFDQVTRRAAGVEFTKDGKLYKIRANKEVILSAGAFHSPQLLMLSGIGPRKHLQELGIEVLQDLPVGELMYDHNTFPGLIFQTDSPIAFPSGNSRSYVEGFLEFITAHTGIITSLGGVESLGYIKTNESTWKEDIPDIEFIFIGGGLHTDKGRAYRKAFRITDDIYNKIWKPLEGTTTVFTVMPMLLHPKSKGYIKLRSKNPYDSPKLYGGIFTDPENKDLKTFIASIREMQRIAKSPALQQYNTRVLDTPIPGCEHFQFDSDFYWECALRHLATSLHHQVATCKMGPPGDPEAVVDNELRVYGVGGLRVADTSIIPIPVAAHTNAPAIMVGEKAADLIKEAWLGPKRREN